MTNSNVQVQGCLVKTVKTAAMVQPRFWETGPVFQKRSCRNRGHSGKPFRNAIPEQQSGMHSGMPFRSATPENHSGMHSGKPFRNATPEQQSGMHSGMPFRSDVMATN